MIKRIFSVILALALTGCTSLPYMYRPGLTVEKPAYKQDVEAEITELEEETSQENLERILNLDWIMRKPDAMHVENYSLEKIKTKDKKEITLAEWKADKNIGEVLIYLNGLESHSGWFANTARQLADAGVDVYGLDRRGSGLNTRVRGNRIDWENDVDVVVDKIRAENKNADINLASICFGARTVMAYLINNPGKVDSAIFYSPGFELKVDLNPIESFEVFLSGFLGFNTHVKAPIKRDEMFTSNQKYLRFLSEDKLRTIAPNSRTYFQGKCLTVYCRWHAKEVETSCMVFLGGEDEVLDLDRTRDFFSKMNNTKFKTYDARHFLPFEVESLAEDTLDWVKITGK